MHARCGCQRRKRRCITRTRLVQPPQAEGSDPSSFRSTPPVATCTPVPIHLWRRSHLRLGSERGPLAAREGLDTRKLLRNA